MSSFAHLLALCTRLKRLCLNCTGPKKISYIPLAPTLALLPDLRVREIYDDALNIAYIMNGLRLSDATRVQPSIDWLAELVNFALPRGTRIIPTRVSFSGIRGGKNLPCTWGHRIYIPHGHWRRGIHGGIQVYFPLPLPAIRLILDARLDGPGISFDLTFTPEQGLRSTIFAILPALQQ